MLREKKIYIHKKYNRKYLLVSCNMRFKDITGTWVDGCIYQPLYDNEHDYFVRSKDSFEQEFELDNEQFQVY